MAGELIIVYDILPELAAKMEEVVARIVKKSAFDLQAKAAAAAPVDTGFLKNSIYVVTGAGESTYGRVQEPSGSQQLLPEVDHPAHKTEATVAVGAEYGVFVEYGSVHGPAQPYLTPAAETMKVQFEHALSHLEEAMAKGSNVGGGGE